MACRHAETGPSGPRAGQPFPAPVTAVTADLGSSTGITLRRAQVVAQGSEQWQAAVDVEAAHQSDSADFTVNEIVAMGRSQIFGVHDRSDQLVADMRRRFEALEATHPSGLPARVFVYDSGTDGPYTAGQHAAPNDIISAAGGVNIMADVDQDWASVGWESVTGRRPEVIVVVDYADQPAADKIAFLKKQPALRSVPAIRNNRFLVLNIGELVSGPRNVDAAEELGKYLRSIGR